MPAPGLAGKTLSLTVSAALIRRARQCLLIGAYLSALGVSFDAIVSSPLKRALQTASLVATEIGFEQKIAVDSSLEPGGRFADFETMLAKHAGQETVLVVGHNPNLAQFAGALIAAQRGARANLRLRKGGLVRVDISRRPAQLLGLVDVRALRQFQTSVAKSSRRKTHGSSRRRSGYRDCLDLTRLRGNARHSRQDAG